MKALRRCYYVVLVLILFLPNVWGQDEFFCSMEQLPNLEEQFIEANLTLKILLVEFRDVRHRNDPSPYLASDFEDMLISFDRYVNPLRTPDGDEVYGSMQDYINKMSSGNVTITGYVVNQPYEENPKYPDWVILPGHKIEYHNYSRPFFADAITSATARGLDVSTSATVKLVIVYAGNSYFQGGLNPSAGGNMYHMSERQDAPYNRENPGDKFARIGIHCHEFAHLLGIGHSSASRADVMEAGYRNGPDHRGAAPAPLNPAWRALKGWLSPIVINGRQQFDVYYSLTAPQVFRINSNSNSEYFLIENRRFNQTMTIGTRTVPDYNNTAFFPSAWPHGAISQGIFVWRVMGGTPYWYQDNGLIYASGRYGQTWPEGMPSETDDGVPFPGNRNVRVWSPWSDPRNPTPNSPPNMGIFVPNSKYGTNVGVEVLSENQAQGYFTIVMYQSAPQDASPSMPQDLRISVVNQGGDNHPKLDWAAMQEPDVITGGKVFIHSRAKIGTGSWGSWVLRDSVAGTVASWIDYGITTAGGGPDSLQYKIQARDTQSKFSVFSDVVSIRWFQQGNKARFVLSETPATYALTQNHPNPFNPETIIRYGVAWPTHVSLRIFDVLGREVMALVNEEQSAGWYEVPLDASVLPSGLYFYRLQTPQYTATRKMLLIK